MLFLCNQLYLSVTSVFEQKNVVFEENIVKQKKCKKELKPNFNKKKNLSTVKEKSESEFVKSGPLDIWRINLLISDLPPGGPTRSGPNEVNKEDGDSPELPRII